MNLLLKTLPECLENLIYEYCFWIKTPQCNHCHKEKTLDQFPVDHRCHFDAAKACNSCKAVKDKNAWRRTDRYNFIWYKWSIQNKIQNWMQFYRLHKEWVVYGDELCQVIPGSIANTHYE